MKQKENNKYISKDKIFVFIYAYIYKTLKNNNINKRQSKQKITVKNYRTHNRTT